MKQQTVLEGNGISLLVRKKVFAQTEKKLHVCFLFQDG